MIYSENLKVIAIPLTLLLLCFTLVSCHQTDNDEALRREMKDGNTLQLINEDVRFYGSESDFYSAVNFYFHHSYSYNTNNTGPYKLGCDYSLYGYDDKFVGGWEMCMFGNWIKEYGLQPNKIYYCATIKYTTYLPILSDGDYVPNPPFDNLGYISNKSNRMFDVEFKKDYPMYAFYTGSRYIGYDTNREGIYLELPNLKNNLIWNFTIAN